METLLSLTKDRDLALKAVANAPPGGRKTALAKLESASMALARFKSKLEAKAKAREAAKAPAAEEDDSDDEEEEESEEEEEEEKASDDEPKKPLAKKKKAAAEEEEEEEEEEEDDDSDDDSDEDDEEEERYEDKDDDDDDDDDDDSEEEEEEQEEEEARAIALKSARSLVAAARKSKDRAALQAAIGHRKALKAAFGIVGKARGKYRKLKAVGAAVTGKKGLSSIIGGIQGLAVTAAQEAKNTADIAKMKAKNKAERVKSLLDAAVRDGKITAKSVPLLRAGMPDYKTLKAYIGALPKLVRTVKDGERHGTTATGGDDSTADRDREQALDFQSLDPEMKEFVTSQAAAQGETVEAFFKKMQAVSSFNAKLTPEQKAGQRPRLATPPLSLKRDGLDLVAHRSNNANGAGN